MKKMIWILGCLCALFLNASAYADKVVTAPATSVYGSGSSEAGAYCAAAGKVTDDFIKDKCHEIDERCTGIPNDDHNPLTPTNSTVNKNSDGSYTAAMDVAVKCKCPSDVKVVGISINSDPVASF